MVELPVRKGFFIPKDYLVATVFHYLQDNTLLSWLVKKPTTTTATTKPQTYTNSHRYTTSIPFPLHRTVTWRKHYLLLLLLLFQSCRRERRNCRSLDKMSVHHYCKTWLPHLQEATVIWGQILLYFPMLACKDCPIPAQPHAALGLDLPAMHWWSCCPENAPFGRSHGKSQNRVLTTCSL